VSATLYAIHHSPWSERARWALEHHGTAFEEREHTPLIGELALRLRSNVKGKASVPLLVDGKKAVQGSLAIAEHAEETGRGAPLFPPGAHESIRALYETLEDSMSAARARFVCALANDREAQLESLPKFLRVLPFARMSARLGISFIAKKYGARDESLDDRMRAGLVAVREALAGNRYVHAQFSFADILGASVVQTIEPLDDAYLTCPPATRSLWMHDALRVEFHDLIQWRNSLYGEHRAKRA
jgi:glutathione S-transferase